MATRRTTGQGGARRRFAPQTQMFGSALEGSARVTVQAQQQRRRPARKAGSKGG